MPKELVLYGEKNNCRQIESKYYERMGNYGPPYVYGVIGKQTDDSGKIGYLYNSAAFWCVNEDNKYDIIIFFRDNLETNFPCATEIPVQEEKYIFPLKVVERKWNLDEFQRMDGKKVRLKGVYESRAIIQENDFYSTTAYVCYKGDWISSVLAE